MEVINEHCTSIQLYEHIVRLNEMYPLTAVIVEDYWQQYKLASWLKNRAAKQLLQIPWMKYKRSRKSKELLIAALQPYIQSHTIQWRSDHVELEDQALQYPRSEHDDMLDALANVLKHSSVPNARDESMPYFMDDEWKDKGLFIPTAKQPEPPSDLGIAVAKALIEKKMNRTRLGKRRFGPPRLMR